MKNLLKETYLLDVGKISKSIERLWQEYQAVLDSKNPSWEAMNRARAILFFLGYFYPEKIALESLEKRVRFIRPEITIDDFFKALDGKDRKILGKYSKNKKFQKLSKFYLLVKGIKNRVENGSYLDEERFNRLYSKLKPREYF